MTNQELLLKVAIDKFPLGELKDFLASHANTVDVAVSGLTPDELNSIAKVSSQEALNEAVKDKRIKSFEWIIKGVPIEDILENMNDQDDKTVDFSAYLKEIPPINLLATIDFEDEELNKLLKEVNEKIDSIQGNLENLSKAIDKLNEILKVQ